MSTSAKAKLEKFKYTYESAVNKEPDLSTRKIGLTSTDLQMKLESSEASARAPLRMAMMPPSPKPSRPTPKPTD